MGASTEIEPIAGPVMELATGGSGLSKALKRRTSWAHGVRAAVLPMPAVQPLDEEALLEAARRTPLFVTAEEHSILGGLGEAVAAALAERLQRPAVRAGVRDTFGESRQAGRAVSEWTAGAYRVFPESVR